MTTRRNFVKTGSLALLAAGQMKNSVNQMAFPPRDPDTFGNGPAVKDRLNQGPFEIDQDQGWRELLITSPSKKPIRNYGTGLVAYTCEENGPAQAVREGRETLEQSIEKLATLPFTDVLYIRCDWRDIQDAPGKLNPAPVWKLTLEAAKQYNLRVGFMIQLSNPEIQPGRLALPDFLQQKIPVVNIGRRKDSAGKYLTDFEYREPQYVHPEFQKAFRELNDLLAAEYNGNPLVEFMDMMMYGFWGEGHTSNLPNPFSDYMTAMNTTLGMTRYQVETWNKTPLLMNTQPDISKTGNDECRDYAIREGCWLRSDSITRIEEPIQVDQLANRPPWLAVAMETGAYRHYKPEEAQVDESGINSYENSFLHVLDLGANYWSLWTEADNLRKYHETWPEGFTTLQRRMGYRVRPSWIWQRKRYDTSEIILCLTNDGVAGVPGILRITLESSDKSYRQSGCLDAGHPYGGKIRQCAFQLPKGMEGQKLNVRAEIEVKGIVRHVTWACAQPLNEDGSISFQLKNFEDPGWRKGV